MFCNRWVTLWLPFFFLSLGVNSNASMPSEKIEKYIALKLKRNDRVLRINEKSIGDEGAKAFAESPQSKKYPKLDLYKNQVTTDGNKYLTESEMLKNCEELEV